MYVERTRERVLYYESYYVRTHERNALVWLFVMLRRML